MGPEGPGKHPIGSFGSTSVSFKSNGIEALLNGFCLWLRWVYPDPVGKHFFVPTYASGSPLPYHMNTMASGEVLRATSPPAILKLALQTGRSRRCLVQNFKHKRNPNVQCEMRSVKGKPFYS